MTTTTYQRLEADIIQARKARDTKRLSVLILLQSKIQRIAKDDGNREIREDDANSGIPEKDMRNDVVLGVSRYKKEVDDMRNALIKAGRSTDEQDFELSIVNGYLPAQLTDEQLDAEIEKALKDTDRTRKAMGIVMKHLNGGFKGMFDPKKANELISSKLS